MDNTYDFLGIIFQHYLDRFGRNGINGLGGSGNGSNPTTDNTTTTYAQLIMDPVSSWSGLCPGTALNTWGNIKFCQGAMVPDVFGHEYAHGLGFYSHWSGSNPIQITYSGESGALEEARADVFGEVFELHLTGAVDWQGGAALVGGASRSLSNPPSVVGYGSGGVPQADRFQSPLFYCGGGDNGGVHWNAGVLGKAGYLYSHGGSFNGCSMAPVGLDKLELILYRATTLYYAQTETFNGAYVKLLQSASDLYGANSAEVTQLRRAL